MTSSHSKARVALSTIATIVAGFIAAPERPLLHDAEQVADRLAAPIVAALQLEGSAALGHPACTCRRTDFSELLYLEQWRQCTFRNNSAMPLKPNERIHLESKGRVFANNYGTTIELAVGNPP